MKNVVFIGSRKNVLLRIVNRKEEYTIKKLWVVENSPLHEEVTNRGLAYEHFKINRQSKSTIIEYLETENYDLLLSNGCPFIFPVTQIRQKRPEALFINTHPSYLPHLKGKTCLNGVFYLDYRFVGATTHFMDDGIDTGNIIFQKKIGLTTDIDQGLVYFIAFNLEGEVFEEALKLLEATRFSYTGKPQSGEGSYFNRYDRLFAIDFAADKNEDIIRKVKSVGISGQGVKMCIQGQNCTLFEAEEIMNPYLIGIFSDQKPGEVLLRYSNKMLIKTVESLLKFSFLAVN